MVSRLERGGPDLTRTLPALLLILLCTAAVSAGEIPVRWDAVPGASGYKVFFGTESGVYTRILDAGNRTSALVNGLDDCTTWYLSVQAYNVAGTVSPMSPEISGWPRPFLGQFVPNAVRQGTQMTWTLDGANFQPGAVLELRADRLPRGADDVPTIRLESTQVLDCHRVQALVSVEPLARGMRAMPLGSFDFELVVHNPGSIFGERSSVLQVEFDPDRWDINRSQQSTRDRVDGADLAWLAFTFARVDEDPRFLVDADLDGNGFVDGADLAHLAAGFGRCRGPQGWDVSACP